MALLMLRFTGVLLLLTLAVFSHPAAASKYDRCSAEGQPPCPVHYKGPPCDRGLGNFGGTCRSCGGEGQRACPKLAKGKPCSGGRMKIDGRCYAQCGGPGQKACPKIKSGYPCRGSYEPDANKFCRPCGGDGHKACRALKSGSQCHAGLTKIEGKCLKCGGEGQRACPALKQGKQCNDGLKKIQGICLVCGGPNERACPKIKGGYPCRGKYEPARNNICKPCGGPNQKACRVFKKGRQCEPGYTERGDKCVACGGLGQRGCKITDKGSACQSGLKLGLNGICKKGEGWAVREAGLRELKRLGPDILPALNSAKALSQDGGLKRGVANQDDAAETLPDNGACPADFRTMSVGLSGEVGIGINVEGETGLAWRCGEEARDTAKEGDENAKNAKWYTSTSLNFRAGGGATGTVTFGWWIDEVNKLRGRSHGYVLDLVDAVQLAQALKAKDFAMLTDNMKSFEPDVAIGLWFERRDEDGDDDKMFDEVGRFLGFTFSIGASAGADLAGGGTYVKAKTNQKCDLDMKCAEGIWQGRVSGRTTTLYVDHQTHDEIYVSIDDSEPVRYERKTNNGRRYDSTAGDVIRFRKNYALIRYEADNGSKGQLKPIVQASVEGVWAGKVSGSPIAVVIDAPARGHLFASINSGERKKFTRGRIARRTYKSADGEVIRFRKNYTLLKFEGADDVKGELTRGSEADIPSATAVIDVLGEWDFTVKGRRLTEEFIAQRPGHVIARRSGSDIERRYDRSGDNAYSTAHGGTFRFVSATRGIWVSPDGQTVFQLQKRE